MRVEPRATWRFQGGEQLMYKKLILAAAGIAALTSVSAHAAESYDLLIRGGTVIDGTGAPGKRADVGVRGGKIVFVGQANGAQARESVDATGLIVTPGFIDAHNHVPDFFLERQARDGANKPAASPITNEAYLAQGVTTIIGGPDGALSPKMLRSAIELFEAGGIGTNYAFYVGHNGVRSEVMGTAHRHSNAAELDQMKKLVREGMQMGAVGLSTGLMYEPGMFSNTEEVIALAKEVKPFDGIYDSHVRDPVFKLLASDEEALRIGREAGIPVKIGHEKAVGLVNKGKIDTVLAMVKKARAAGEDVVTDQYPYDGAATATLDQVIIVPELPDIAFAGAPGAAMPKIQQALRDTSRLAKIKAATEHGINGGFSWVKAVGYGSMRIVDSKDFPELIGRNVQLLADERKQAPFEVLVELILASRTPTLLTLGAVDEQDLRKLLVEPWNMIASDGSYVGKEGSMFDHPRSTGTFTRVIGHYTRDEKQLTLPDAVRKMTSFPADFLRLYDRGRLQAGKAADIVVFDAAAVRDNSTWAKPNTLSTGVRHVIVNGTLAIKDGAPTGATPGRFIKRQARAGG
jgi:N-acyl-D-amino-acid deacylase